MNAFTDRTVPILDDSHDIGAAIVHRFIADGANARFTYVKLKDAAKRLAQETGMTAVFTGSADEDTVIDVVHKSGALDILVVNAGISVFGKAPELNADDIDRPFKINIHVPYHASVEAARQMPRDGRILTIGSVNGDRTPVAGMVAYATSESALRDMAHGLARDFGSCGITINVIQPGPININASPANGLMRDMLRSLVAIKKHRQPEEVTGMVTWLTGPEASFITGTVYIIDGTFGA